LETLAVHSSQRAEESERMTDVPSQGDEMRKEPAERTESPLTLETAARLVAEADDLAASLARLRVLVSAPTSCDVLLEEVGAVRDEVDRFACGLAAAFLDAQLDARLAGLGAGIGREGNEAAGGDREAVRRFVLALSSTVGRFG
jgi:hypothetical protein